MWSCDASTSTKHKNHQTSNLNMKYCSPENTIKGSVQITIKGRHSPPTVVCVCVFFPFILDVKFQYLRGNFLDGNGIIYFDLNGTEYCKFFGNG